MCTEKMHSKIRCIKYSETNNNIIQDILSRNVQLNSWQVFIKPWDGFCGPFSDLWRCGRIRCLHLIRIA